VKRAPTAADIRRGHLRVRQRQLRDLIARLAGGRDRPIELPSHEALQILEILETIQAGRDPREWFGIKSARGPEVQHVARDWLITACFLKLREVEPTELEKVHRLRLSQFTGLKDATIRGIVTNKGNVDLARNYAKVTSAKTLENMLRGVLSAEGSGGNLPHTSLFTSEN
jgi:hypothetical protein